jgi:hypothetical protein
MIDGTPTVTDTITSLVEFGERLELLVAELLGCAVVVLRLAAREFDEISQAGSFRSVTCAG